RWVKVRDDVRIDAVVACKTATTSMLKAPDSVEWKDHEEGYDPNQDWIYNVDLQANAMNSFGAKLRSTFYCSAVCTDKEGSNGLRCIAMKVREGE
ncbi:MAG TPA: hypothetical protein VFY05_05710, partial [Candidatus Angelobacter sp.]|nr:hypothetical protein [Candidatus Angelobacter sp.]